MVQKNTQVSSSPVATSRIEAFSDGVIAIIITIMVFELKLEAWPLEGSILAALLGIAPMFLSYSVSFVTLAVLWVNHHQLFHQIRNADRGLLWHAIHLLFWMSLVPFATHIIGAEPLRWESACVYGLLFFMNALAFTMLRGHALKKGLFHDTISRDAQIKVRRKNRIAMAIYLVSAFAGIVSVYISFIGFLIVPAMYFLPQRIVHHQTDSHAV